LRGIAAAATIAAADGCGLPVSTTHVLSSGIAGTMKAHGSGPSVVNDRQHSNGVGIYFADSYVDLRYAVFRAFHLF